MTVSALTTSQVDIFALILGELTGSPNTDLDLTRTRAQMLAAILTEVGGVTVSALQVGEGELERRAIVAFDTEMDISFPASTTTEADIWADILNALTSSGGGASNNELREDGGLELREDGGKELRE